MEIFMSVLVEVRTVRSYFILPGDFIRIYGQSLRIRDWSTQKYDHL